MLLYCCLCVSLRSITILSTMAKERLSPPPGCLGGHPCEDGHYLPRQALALPSTVARAGTCSAAGSTVARRRRALTQELAEEAGLPDQAGPAADRPSAIAIPMIANCVFPARGQARTRAPEPRASRWLVQTPPAARFNLPTSVAIKHETLKASPDGGQGPAACGLWSGDTITSPSRIIAQLR